MDNEVYRNIGKQLRTELLARYSVTEDKELARRLGLSEETIQEFARERSLSKSKAWIKRQGGSTRMPRWNPDEIELLTEFYPFLPAHEIAQRLGRSAKAVVAKANKLRLKKSFERLSEMGRENVALRYLEEEKAPAA